MRRNTRRYRRVGSTFVSKVVERHLDPQKIRTIEAELSNIGAGGVFVRVDDPPTKGTIVEVHFELPDSGRKMTALGLVRWARRGKGAGMGIRFCRIEEGTQEDRDLFVESQDGLAEKADTITDAFSGDEVEPDGGEE